MDLCFLGSFTFELFRCRVGELFALNEAALENTVAVSARSELWLLQQQRKGFRDCGAERWSKEKDPWEAQEPDWRLRTCKVYESVGSSTDRMHESCESTLSPAEHLINSLSPSTLTLSNVNPFLLGHYDKRYQGQTSWHHTVRLLTLLGGHLTYLEGGGSNSISLTASAPIEVKEQAASVSREPWAVAILRCFEETWLKDESMK